MVFKNLAVTARDTVVAAKSLAFISLILRSRSLRRKIFKVTGSFIRVLFKKEPRLAIPKIIIYLLRL